MAENPYEIDYFDPKERRKFLRLDANFVLSYYVYPGQVDKTDMTLTRNISLGGICFTSDTHFPMGTVLRMTLRLPKVTKLIDALGEVMYIRQEKNRKLLFDIGMKFVKIEDSDLYILDKIVQQCSSSEKKEFFKNREDKK